MIETFFAWGRGGQFIFVLPEFDLVAVFTSRPYDNSYGVLLPLGIVPNYIIPVMLPPAPAQKTIQINPEVFEKYQGKYEFKKWNTKLSIIKEDEIIYMTDPHGGMVELKPLSETQFHGTLKVFGNITIDFDMEDDEEVSHLILNYGFLHLTFDKIT